MPVTELPVRRDLTVTVGDEKAVELIVTGDRTDDDWQAQVRRSPGEEGVPLADWIVAVSLYPGAEARTLIAITLPGAVTGALDAYRVLAWDLRSWPGAITWLAGRLNVRQAVTVRA